MYFFTSLGTLFQSPGPTTLNDLSAKVFLVVIGMVRFFPASAERSPACLVGILVKRACRYKGAFPFGVS